MSRRENVTAIGAIVVAAATLLPLASNVRIVLAVVAIAAILSVLATRLRAHADAPRTSGESTYARIERIRAERAKRGR